VRLAVLLVPVRQARLAVPKALAVARVAQIAHAWPEIHQPAPERTPRRRAVDLAVARGRPRLWKRSKRAAPRLTRTELSSKSSA